MTPDMIHPMIENTRQALDQIPTWVDNFARRLPRPERVPVDGRGFQWRHAENTAEVLQVAKAARMVAALRAALVLADSGYTTECGSLLRTACDFSDEIIFLCEPNLTGSSPTTAHTDFIKQGFQPIPKSPEEWMERKKEHYVRRGEVLKASLRIANMTEYDGEFFRGLLTQISHTYDKYVHGNYETAMELYTERTNGFMTTGVESELAHLIRSMLGAVAGTTNKGIEALEFMSLTRGSDPLYHTIREIRQLHEEACSLLALP